MGLNRGGNFALSIRIGVGIGSGFGNTIKQIPKAFIQYLIQNFVFRAEVIVNTSSLYSRFRRNRTHCRGLIAAVANNSGRRRKNLRPGAGRLALRGDGSGDFMWRILIRKDQRAPSIQRHPLKQQF